MRAIVLALVATSCSSESVGLAPQAGEENREPRSPAPDVQKQLPNDASGVADSPREVFDASVNDLAAEEDSARVDAQALVRDDTLMTRRGRLLLDESFTPTSWKANWVTYKGVFTLVDGHLQVGEQPGSNHPAEASHRRRFRDLVVQFRFRIDGARWMGLQMSDDRVPHHLLNVMVTPGGLALHRVTGWGGTTKSTRLDGRAMTFSRDRWHTVLFELRGRELLVRLDGGCPLHGEDDGVAAEKTRFFFISGGSLARYADVKVWEALPNPDWPQRKDELMRARQACP